MPSDPVARLWHSATMLREHRCDGHIAALVGARIGGTEAHVFSALEMGIHPPESFGRIHHLPKKRLAEVMEGLRERGLVNADGWFTDAGRETRVVEYQEWQRWVDGFPVRRYCWIGDSGEIRFDEGEPISAEGNPLRAADLDGDWDDFDIANEQTVMAVAAEWSIDPTMLEEHDDLPPHGLLGFLVQI